MASMQGEYVEYSVLCIEDNPNMKHIKTIYFIHHTGAIIQLWHIS